MAGGQVIDKYVFSLFLSSKGFVNGISSATKSLFSFKTAFAAVAASTAGFVFAKSLINQYTNLSNSIGRLSEQTGESMRSIQAWQFAMKREGLSAENFDATLKMLNDDMANIANFGEGKTWGVFARLGVNIHHANGKLKDATELLSDVAKTMAKLPNMSEREKFNFTDALGIDRDTATLLIRSKGRIDDIIASLIRKALVEREDFERTKKWNAQVAELTRSWQQFAISVSPELMNIALNTVFPTLETFFKYMEQNKGKIKDFFREFLDVAKDTMPDILELSKNLGTLVLLMAKLGAWTSKQSRKLGGWIYDSSKETAAGILTNSKGKKYVVDKEARKKRFITDAEAFERLYAPKVPTASSVNPVAVNIGDITIHTQATNAKEISRDFGAALSNEIDSLKVNQ